MLTCSFCKYTTNKKFNLDRHQINKHSIEIMNKIRSSNNGQNVSPNGQNVNPNGQNVNPNGQNVNPNGQNVNPNIENVSPSNLICKQCNKIYKTEKHLIEHEKKCNRIDNLTCPKCMISFTCRQGKNKHIKRNNCEAKSIFNARIPNKQNINTQINNSCNYTNIDSQQNNIININNYGNERLDYMDYDKYLEIFKKFYDIPSVLIKEIHFNNNFPENNNIKYNDQKTALIKDDDKFIIKDLQLLVDELIKNKSRLIQDFAYYKKEDICNSISAKIYEEVIELLFKMIVKEPIIEYKKQANKIIDMIKNNS